MHTTAHDLFFRYITYHAFGKLLINFCACEMPYYWEIMFEKLRSLINSEVNKHIKVNEKQEDPMYINNMTRSILATSLKIV